MHSAASMQSLMRRPTGGSSFRRLVDKDDDKVVSRKTKESSGIGDFHKSCGGLLDFTKASKRGESDEILVAKSKLKSRETLHSSYSSLGASFSSLGGSISSLGGVSTSTDKENESELEKLERKRRKQERQRQKALQAEADRWSQAPRAVAATAKPLDAVSATEKAAPPATVTSSASTIPRRSSIRRPSAAAAPCDDVVPNTPKKTPKSPKKSIKVVPPPALATPTPVSPIKAPTTPRQRARPAYMTASYSARHIKAATRIAALLRGKKARMQLHYLRLRRRLDNMERDKAKDIKRIQKETAAAQKEFKARATERFKKNLARQGGSGDAAIHDNQDAIAKIRKENADLRERNQALFAEMQKLATNNARLEASNQTSTDCIDRVAYHDDAIKIEHAKLTKIHGTYEQAVNEHTSHVQLHTTYGDTEHAMKNMYRRLLINVLDRVEGYHDQELVDEIYAEVEALESTWGKIGLPDSTSKKEGKKEKKNGKKGKKDSKAKKREQE